MIGYDKLNNANKKMFDQFLANFMAAQGTDARNEIIPTSVRFVQEGFEQF